MSSLLFESDAQRERRSPDIPYVPRARIEACPQRRIGTPNLRYNPRSVARSSRVYATPITVVAHSPLHPPLGGSAAARTCAQADRSAPSLLLPGDVSAPAHHRPK